jgi:hypothetical protein
MTAKTNSTTGLIAGSFFITHQRKNLASETANQSGY